MMNMKMQFDTNGKPGERLIRDSSVGVNRFRFR